MLSAIKQVDFTGVSNTSLLDAGIGLGVGLGVPVVTEMAIRRFGTQAPQWLFENRKWVAMGTGALFSFGLIPLRGIGAAVISFAASVLYGVADMLTSALESGMQSVAGALNPPENANQQQGGEQPAGLGLLTAHEDFGALRVETGMPAAIAAGNSAVFGGPAFGGPGMNAGYW